MLNLGVYRREMRRQRKELLPVAEQFADVVVAVAAELTRKQRGLLLVFGELPTTLQLVTRAVTYGEWMAFHAIDNLDEAATAHALAHPAKDAGRPFDADALDRLITVDEGSTWQGGTCPRNELLEAGILTASRQGHIASSLPGVLDHVLTVADEP